MAKAKRNSSRNGSKGSSPRARQSQTQNRIVGRTRPQPGFEGEPDPAAVNRDHPDRPGRRKSVPGAGVVRAEADVTVHPTSPGPLFAPNARRAGTTISGVSSTPDIDAPDAGDRATETASAGGTAPLSVPEPDVAGPRPGASGVREISDPNFPITHAKRSPGRQSGRRPKSRDKSAR
jgi:hypothetical protein